jgi:hypothetical protein
MPKSNPPELTDDEKLAAEIRRAVVPAVAADLLWHEMPDYSREASLRAATVAREIGEAVAREQDAEFNL